MHPISLSCRRAFLATLTLTLAACGGGGGGDATPAPVPGPLPALAPQVTMTLSNGAGVSGDIVITLDNTRAPVTAANFLAYVNAGFYNGTVIHRHAPNFVLQGGGYAGPLVAGGPLPTLKATNAPIALEVGRGLSNVRLSVAMARTEVLNSATSQFFINLGNNASLDTVAGGYAVFGNITAGEAVVTAMTTAPCVAWSGFTFPNECIPSPNITVTRAVQSR